jgi:hypothetical protein
VATVTDANTSRGKALMAESPKPSHFGLVPGSWQLGHQEGTYIRNANRGTVMAARGKEHDVAVQCEALEFLAGSDLDLSGSNCSADQKHNQCAVPECEGQFQGYWRGSKIQICVSDCENIFCIQFL